MISVLLSTAANSRSRCTSATSAFRLAGGLRKDRLVLELQDLRIKNQQNQKRDPDQQLAEYHATTAHPRLQAFKHSNIII